MTQSPPVVPSVFDSLSPLLSEEAKASPTFKTIGGEGIENIPTTGVLIKSLAVNAVVVITIHGSEEGRVVKITFISFINHTLLFKEF